MFMKLPVTHFATKVSTALKYKLRKPILVARANKAMRFQLIDRTKLSNNITLVVNTLDKRENNQLLPKYALTKWNIRSNR